MRIRVAGAALNLTVAAGAAVISLTDHWLNQVDRWFAEIARRKSVAVPLSVCDLIKGIVSIGTRKR